MTFTAADVQAAIEDNDTLTVKYSRSDTGYEVGPWEWYAELESSTTPMLNINGQEYEVKHVDSYGGMDMGSELWVVFEIDGRLFKKYGAYYSHDGSYWDGSLTEVKPVQKTITVFEE